MNYFLGSCNLAVMQAEKKFIYSSLVNKEISQQGQGYIRAKYVYKSILKKSLDEDKNSHNSNTALNFFPFVSSKNTDPVLPYSLTYREPCSHKGKFIS